MNLAVLLAGILKGRVVIVGIGNPLKGDDGLGSWLVERLKKKLPVPCINAGSTLENYLGPIAKEQPDTVLLIDAVQLGRRPGAYEILGPEAILETGLSTHDVSLRFALELLGRLVKGKIWLLGVQPQTLRLGAGLSGRIRRTLRALERRIESSLPVATG